MAGRLATRVARAAAHAPGVAGWVCVCVFAVSCTRGPIEVAFWIEPVSFSSPRIGAPITSAELAKIESVARAEIATAFDRFQLTMSSDRHARYRVRVVQQLFDRRFRHREASVAGASRGAAGFGGSGEVNFEFVANGAMVFAPQAASRSEVIEALGRGVGRVAIHEFLHQLLPKAPIDDRADPRSYEGSSAASIEGYWGDLHWGIAGPLLEERVGRR